MRSTRPDPTRPARRVTGDRTSAKACINKNNRLFFPPCRAGFCFRSRFFFPFAFFFSTRSRIYFLFFVVALVFTEAFVCCFTLLRFVVAAVSFYSCVFFSCGRLFLFILSPFLFLATCSSHVYFRVFSSGLLFFYFPLFFYCRLHSFFLPSSCSLVISHVFLLALLQLP